MIVIRDFNKRDSLCAGGPIDAERWAHLVSNQGPTGYEPVALPAELWARYAQHQSTQNPLRLSRHCSRSTRGHGSKIFDKTPEDFTAAGVAKLTERLGFNLSDAFSRHIKIVSDLLQRVS